MPYNLVTGRVYNRTYFDNWLQPPDFVLQVYLNWIPSRLLELICWSCHIEIIEWRYLYSNFVQLRPNSWEYDTLTRLKRLCSNVLSFPLKHTFWIKMSCFYIQIFVPDREVMLSFNSLGVWGAPKRKCPNLLACKAILTRDFILTTPSLRQTVKPSVCQTIKWPLTPRTRDARPRRFRRTPSAWSARRTLTAATRACSATPALSGVTSRQGSPSVSH